MVTKLEEEEQGLQMRKGKRHLILMALSWHFLLSVPYSSEVLLASQREIRAADLRFHTLRRSPS